MIIIDMFPIGFVFINTVDTFVIYTKASDSVINLTYGYLESYDGYHSK